MPKRVTITDVARESGVSIKTVSNVINSTGSMRPETRARVEETIKQLGYRINMSARAMKTGGTQLLGLALSDFDQPFMPYLASSMVTAARKRGYAVITVTYGNEGNIEAILPDTQRLAADGWIFFVNHPLRADTETLRQPYPLVAVGDYDVHGLVDWVTMPNTEAVRTAVGELLDSGCHRIALIGGTASDDALRHITANTDDVDSSTSNEPFIETTSTLRTRGYCEAYVQRGLDIDQRLIRNSDWVQSSGRDAVAQLLDDLDAPMPQAIVCMNDAVAIGVIAELQRRRLSVPRDVQVIGFDNVPDAEFSMPGLTTIDPHIDDYASHAIDMLIDRINGYDGEARTYTTSYDVVHRASTR